MIDVAGTRTPRRGIVLSDLHLFAYRSVGQACFDGLRPLLAESAVLVLNGDIFDFRWSTLPGRAASADAAAAWLRGVRRDFPALQLHYVLGNHDCPEFFRQRLAEQAAADPRFNWHETGVRIGGALFVHGDCAHRRMDAAGLRRYRQVWDNERQHSLWRARAYAGIDRTGVTHLVHACWFPRRSTIRRLTHYLDRAWSGWRNGTTDCFFGHTHLAFSDHRAGTVRFHNTGSGLKGQRFNPRRFEAADDFAPHAAGATSSSPQV